MAVQEVEVATTSSITMAEPPWNKSGGGGGYGMSQNCNEGSKFGNNNGFNNNGGGGGYQNNGGKPPFQKFNNGGGYKPNNSYGGGNKWNNNNNSGSGYQNNNNNQDGGNNQNSGGGYKPNFQGGNLKNNTESAGNNDGFSSGQGGAQKSNYQNNNNNYRGGYNNNNNQQQNQYGNNNNGNDQQQQQNLNPYNDMSSKIVLELISHDYFSIKFQKFFNQDCSEMVKQLKQKGKDIINWDVQRKQWNVRIDEYNDLLQQFTDYLANNPQKSQVDIKGIPNFAFELLNGKPLLTQDDQRQDNRTYSMGNLPPSMRDNLFEYQKNSVILGVKQQGRFMILDEMGLGKTLESLAVAMVYFDEWPLLVVCPSQMKNHWREEILKWVPDFDPSQITVMRKGREAFNDNSKVFITSYKIAARQQSQIQKRFQVVICDESQALKTPNTRYILRLNGVHLKILLFKRRSNTGSLKLKRDALHFRQQNYLNQEKERCCHDMPPILKQKLHIKCDLNEMQEIRVILNGRMLSESMQTLFVQLKNIEKEAQRITEIIKCKMDRMSTSANNYNDVGNLLGSNQKDDQLIDQLFEVSSQARIKGILKTVSQILENEQKVIVIAQQNQSIEEIENTVRKVFDDQREKNESNYNYIRIDNNTPSDLKQQMIRNFQENPIIKVVILSLATSSLASVLTSASNIIFAETYWNNEQMAQAIFRDARSLNQDQQCLNVYYLYAKDSLDEIIFQIMFPDLVDFYIGNFSQSQNTRQIPDQSNQQLYKKSNDQFNKRDLKYNGKQMNQNQDHEEEHMSQISDLDMLQQCIQEESHKSGGGNKKGGLDNFRYGDQPNSQSQGQRNIKLTGQSKRILNSSEDHEESIERDSSPDKQRNYNMMNRSLSQNGYYQNGKYQNGQDQNNYQQRFNQDSNQNDYQVDSNQMRNILDDGQPLSQKMDQEGNYQQTCSASTADQKNNLSSSQPKTGDEPARVEGFFGNQNQKDSKKDPNQKSKEFKPQFKQVSSQKKSQPGQASNNKYDSIEDFSCEKFIDKYQANMRKNSQKANVVSERPSLNNENLHPLQAHYQQYLQQYNNNFYSSADLSLSQSEVSDVNYTQKMIDSQRSSRLNMSKKSLPANNYQNNQSQNVAASNSASSKGTPSFQHGQRVKKGLTNLPSNNANKQSQIQNKNSNQQQMQYLNTNTQSKKQQTSQRKPQNTPMVVEFQISNKFSDSQNISQSNTSNNNTQTHKSMKANHKKNQPSITSNTSSAQMNQHFQQTTKHLRFDSVQDSSTVTNQQLMSITSQHYQGLISGSSSEINDQDRFDDDNLNGDMREFREVIMTESPQQQKNQITLSNSLLECVDQYGNNIDQYSVLMGESENGRGDSSSKKQLMSELNNPNSYLNSITKDLRAYGSIHQEDTQNVYNVQLANTGGNQNFIVCSPSVNTDDDCQYTNSSAVRSIISNSGMKNQYSNYNKRTAQLIYTDERKEENLSSNQIDEMENTNNGQFSSDDKDQFTGDKGDEDEEIESKLQMITGSSQIYKSKDYQDKGSSFQPDTSSQRQTKFEYVQQTPTPASQQNQQYFQILDSDSRNKMINDTPQVMQMIDQSNNASSTRQKKSNYNSQRSKHANIGEQLSPEVLGSRENRRRNQRKENQDQNKKESQTRNSSRYLNFKDISPLVKSCNTFTFENTLPNQSTLEVNMMGKISPPFMQNHYPSVIQRDNFGFNNTMHSLQNSKLFLDTIKHANQLNQHNYQTTQGTLVNFRDQELRSPNQEFQLTGKLSSVLESPPPLTETSPEKGIKDFSRQYLNHGMWPSKGGHHGYNDMMISRIQDASMLSSNRGINNSMKIGDQIKRLENQMSSVSKKIYVSQQNNNLNNPLYSSADMFTQAQTNGTFQNPLQSQSINQAQVNSLYPNIDQSIVQKINTTLDNMNNQFYFKRPSDHIGIGNSSINQLRTSRDNSKANISGTNLLNNIYHPYQIGSNQHRTMANNTVFNQSSFDDICNIHGGTADQQSNITQIHNNDPYGAPLTSRSNNNPLNQSKVLPQNMSTITYLNNNQNNMSQRHLNKSSDYQAQNRFSNVSDPVRKVTLNGFGLGNINQKMQVGDAYNTVDNENGVNHNHHNQSSSGLCCKECIFEKEKRKVTQSAFERALGISLFLMEEIDKINVKSTERHRPSNISVATSNNNQLQISRQEIMNLMNQTQHINLKGQGGMMSSPGTASLNGGVTTHHNSQTRLSRSKSQSMMPVEFANLQRSLQIPRGGFTGAFPGILNNLTPNLSYI
eukprot:403338635